MLIDDPLLPQMSDHDVCGIETIGALITRDAARAASVSTSAQPAGQDSRP
jgi:hypothetical protein